MTQKLSLFGAISVTMAISLAPSLVLASIAITKVAPNAAALDDDTLITLTGNGFREDCGVKLGDSACKDVRLVNGETLVCRVPKHDKAESVQLSVNCPNENLSVNVPFNYYSPLTIAAPHLGELGTNFTLEIDGGLAPYNVYWNQLNQYYQAQQTSDQSVQVAPTSVGTNTIIVQDAAGNQTEQQITFVPSLITSISIAPSVPEHSSIGIPALSGSNPSDLKIDEGDAVLTKNPQGGYHLTFGHGAQTVKLSAKDDFQTLNQSIWVAANGYSDSTINVGGGDTEPSPLTMAFGSGEVYSVQKAQNGQRVQVNSLADGLSSWNTGDNNFGEKDAVSISTISPTGDKGLFIGGYANHEGVFSEYIYPFLRKLTPDGTTDKTFAPKLDFPHGSSILKLLARNDGGAWGVVNVQQDKHGSYLNIRYLILWDAHGQETKRITMGQSTQGSGPEIQITSDQQEGLYILKSEKTGMWVTSISHMDRNGNSDLAFESATQKSLAGLQASASSNLAISNFAMSKDHLYFISQTGSAYDDRPKWTGAINTNQSNLTVLNLDGSLSTSLSKTGVNTAVFDVQNRLITELQGALKRFLPDGSVDTSYGFQGAAIFNPYFIYSASADVLVPYQANGRSFLFEVRDFGLTRMVQ